MFKSAGKFDETIVRTDCFVKLSCGFAFSNKIVKVLFSAHARTISFKRTLEYS